MNSTTLDVKEICGEKIFTRDDAKPLFEKISESLKQFESITIDFGNREIASESFLDEAVVEHFLNPIFPGAPQKIFLKNVINYDQMLLRRIFDYRKRIALKQSKKRASSNNAA